MNQVVKMENTKTRKLNWKQEEELRQGKKNHRGRRDLKKGNRQVWENDDV